MSKRYFLNEKPFTFEHIKIGGFELCCSNKLAAMEMYEEIFIKKSYDFETNKKSPFIIDAGSNIGLAVLFFKQKYPDSTITCFEADPNAFRLLQRNVENNKLTNVKLINAAISSKTGLIKFYGDINSTEPDQRGNSIIKEWGSQRQTSSELLVKSVKLSSYINQEIDFLKMDVEGAEQEVL